MLRWFHAPAHPALLLLAATALCVSEGHIAAQPVVDSGGQAWALDGARSRAGFQIRAVWMFNVGGTLGALSGAVVIDNFRNTATVDARIDASAVSMRNPEYAAWLKSAEFFDVAHYPEIHFVSDPTPLPRLRSGGEMRGTLEIRGVSRPVTFQLEANACQGRLAHDCAVHAVGTIQRSAFGMTTRRVTLADKVDLDITIFVTEVATPAKAPADAPPAS